MDSSTGNEVYGDNEQWWTDKSALSPTPISTRSADRMLKALSQEYSVLADVASNMSSGFVLLNSKEGVTYFNSSAVRLLGVRSRDLIEQPIFDIRKQLLTLAADPTSISAELNHAWDSPQEEISTDFALADAAVRWLRVRCFPVHDSLGTFLGRGILLDDITLERSSLETRSETLALAAHELKTPLAIIKGCATTLLGNSARWDPTMLREMLQMIDTQTDRLYDVLNTLLDVWRLDSGTQTLRFSQISLGDLLSQLVQRWQKNAPHHSFVLRLPPHISSITCDVVRVEHAFNALLNNAITYSPNGGAITIQLESNDFEIRVSITDEGMGIAPEHLERIFERFYRVEQDGEPIKGSGLGLAVARSIIEAHHGKIWGDSLGLGQGATIYVTLPFTPPRAAIAPSQTTSPTPVPVGGPLTLPSVPSTGPLQRNVRPQILIAERDARMIRYLRANLEEHSYRVQTANQGIQFLRQFDLEEPDVILLATQVADMSGLELLQRLREFSQVPVIILSEPCAEDECVQFFDLGADDVVTKPFGMKEMLARIRALLRRQIPAAERTINSAIFTTGDLSIDYAQHLVLLKGQPVQLSRTEYKLLSTLAHNAGMVLTHEVLLERVWGPEYDREVGFIWVYISRLRRKIEDDPRNPRYVLTVPDVGYKLVKL